MNAESLAFGLSLFQLLDGLAKMAIVVAAIRFAFVLGGWKKLGESLTDEVKRLAAKDEQHDKENERQDKDIARVSESLASVAAVVGQHDQWIHAQKR